MSTSKLENDARTGLDVMDKEHALELQMVRALKVALVEGDRAKVIVLMDELEVFANAHFLAEQLLMRLHAYPGFASHQVDHDRLIAELRELSARIAGSPEADARSGVEALELWLLTHIHSEDQALADFLRRPADGEART